MVPPKFLSNSSGLILKKAKRTPTTNDASITLISVSRKYLGIGAPNYFINSTRSHKSMKSDKSTYLGHRII
jgi:hypothetical protein